MSSEEVVSIRVFVDYEIPEVTEEKFRRKGRTWKLNQG